MCLGYYYFDYDEMRWILYTFYMELEKRFMRFSVPCLLRDIEVPSDLKELFERMDKSVFVFNTLNLFPYARL